LLKQGLTLAGKALLVVLGVGYGVAKALEVLRPDSSDQGSPLLAASAEPFVSSQTMGENPKPADYSPLAEGPEREEAWTERFDRMEQRLKHLENSIEVLTAPIERASSRNSGRNAENFVTRSELSAALEQFSNTVDADIGRRFDIQNRSIQSLRTMVARTDELLEQVLESIESASIAAQIAR
jgi:hypothetical protein